jgi:hypothetical protein
MSAKVRSQAPKSGGQRAEVTNKVARRSCFDCVFCISNVLLWAQTLTSGFAVGGQCANHPDTPGQVRRIPLRPCRNFRGKPLRTEPPQPPNDKIRYIPLTRGLHAIVDAEDYEWLSQYKWYAQPTVSHQTFHAVRNSRRGKVFMHRMIMPPPHGMLVDHINGNGLDNRRCNLRICTRAENSRNGPKRAGTKSRFIGVHPRGGKWQVCVTYKGKEHYLGLFDDEVEAAKARDLLARKLHGKYARLNIPPDSPEAEG